MGTTTTNTAVTKKPGRRWRRWLVRIVAVCFPAWIGLLIYVDWAMHQPPEVFGHVMAKMPMPVFLVVPFETMWNHARPGRGDPGAPAQGFRLMQVQGAEAQGNLAGGSKVRPG